MASSSELRGIQVLVAGAGLAGLAAARELETRGADVTVIEARDRVGGRVWTIRAEFRRGQHAEAGADLIDGGQQAVVGLAKELGLSVHRVLKRGFGYCAEDRHGRLCLRSAERAFRSVRAPLGELVQQYQWTEQRWDSPIVKALARRTVADWLTGIGADQSVVSRFRGLRGLFLADIEDLSLLALVDFFAEGGFGEQGLFRLTEGNDRLPSAMAGTLRRPVQLRSVLRRVRAGDRVEAQVEQPSGVHVLQADYLIAALPATSLRTIEWESPLPQAQREAFARLRYGPATRLLIQFARRFWRRAGRQNAFGSDQPIGAVWDGNERQRGTEGILSLLAGGRASAELQAVLQSEGLDGVVRRLTWLGDPASALASHAVVWEADPWAQGGYAYFDPSFDPALRDWLSRPAGRVAFAGEHTSLRWQGYMNGAVESGRRAAAEIVAMTGLT